MMANRRNGAVYTGVTSDLVKRVWQHRQGVAGFTARYACKMLVWYEMRGSMEDAILREKQIKGGSRPKKLALIEAMNLNWADLWGDIAHPCAERDTAGDIHSEPSSDLRPHPPRRADVAGKWQQCRGERAVHLVAGDVAALEHGRDR